MKIKPKVEGECGVTKQADLKEEEYIEEAKVKPILKPTEVKEVPASGLLIYRGDIIGKDIDNPEWLTEVHMDDKVFYLMSEGMMARIREGE